MRSYRVRFLNKLLSSDGHSFTSVQRTVSVVADDADQATRLAQRQFEQLERVTDWRNHAQRVEVEPEENGDREASS